MPAIGGSIESVTIDGRIFAVAADAESQRKLGGFENEVQMNGDGTGRIIKTRIPPVVDGLTISIDDDNEDSEFLQERANGKVFFPFAITYASGNTYQGVMMITGEVQVSSQNATAAVSLMGTGELTKQ